MKMTMEICVWATLHRHILSAQKNGMNKTRVAAASGHREWYRNGDMRTNARGTKGQIREQWILSQRRYMDFSHIVVGCQNARPEMQQVEEAISMNDVNIVLWGREFHLPVSYSWYPGEQVTDSQKKSVQDFCAGNNAGEMLEQLKKYVADKSDGQVEVAEIDNIFRYVMPKCLYVPRTDDLQVAVLCNYKFDMEHGIAIVFKNGRFAEIGAQDIVL